MADLVQYAQKDKLPQLFVSFLYAPVQHLNLNGAQHDMFRTKITDAQLQKIAQILIDLPAHDLVLDLSCNYLTDECALSINKLLPVLKGLSLRANGLTAAFCYSISSSLAASKLRYLDLSQNVLGAEGAYAILHNINASASLHYGIIGESGVQPYGSLQYLNLYCTAFGQHAMIELQQYLRSRFCGLIELYLSELDDQQQARLADALQFNTSLYALTITNTYLNPTIIDAFIAYVAVDSEELKETDAISKRINDMRLLQKRYTQRLDLPRPLLQIDESSQLRLAVTPIRFLDFSACSTSFQLCEALNRHLENADCYLQTIILDGCKIQSKGANLLARALLKYQVRTLQCDFYVDSQQNNLIEEQYQLFGYIDTDEGYSQHYKNISFGALRGQRTGGICLSLKRCGISGQGVCTIGLLAKFNEYISYVGLEQNSFESEKGIERNAQQQWYPKIEWESTFSVRTQAGKPLTCDFGLKRTSDLTQIQWYKDCGRILKGMAVFE